jgi:hypothetical protein
VTGEYRFEGCPLWVKTRQSGGSAPCPLIPQEQTFAKALNTSASCQQRTSLTGWKPPHPLLRSKFFHVSCREPERLCGGAMLGCTMPTNMLRAQASRFLHLALKAHDSGQFANAHEFTVIELLEGAVSLEELRKADSRVPASSLPSRNSRSAKSGEELDNSG